MINSMTFGLRLRTLREQRGVSLNALARNIGVSAGYLSNLESGKTEHISLSRLNEISDVLKAEVCPFCNQVVNVSSKSFENNNLVFRIDLVHQSMTELINSNPEFLKQVLELLENGIYLNVPTTDV